jgi:hypothetical protein
VAALAVFVLLLMPFLLHEVRAGFLNVAAARALAASGASATESVPRRLYEVLVPGLIGGFVTGGIEPLAVVVAAALAVALATRRGSAELLLGGLLVATLAQAVLYRGPIFEHYFVALAPLVFLALGAVPARAALVGGVVLLAVNVWQTPLSGPPLEHLARTFDVARAIDAQAGDGPFGLWLMANDDTDGAYRYQLARLGRSPARADEPEPRQLFLVCQSADCDATQLQEAAGPEWASATRTWQATLHGVTVVGLTAP